MKARNCLKIQHVMGLLIIMALTLIAFYPAFDNEFVNWDDQFYVTANPLINNPSWASLRELLTKVVSLNYHPLTMLSLWANAITTGIESARAFIITNTFIHSLNAIMVYLLTYWLANKRLIVALFSSLIFAIHPMHVESVVWVSERKDVLYAFFFLASLLCYVGYLSKGKTLFLVCCFCTFLLSCLSKAMAVSLVPCLIAVDYLHSRDPKRWMVYIEKIPFVLLALLVGLVAVDLQSGGDFYGLLQRSERADAIESDQFSLLGRLSNSCFANFYYVTQFFIPLYHSPFHPYTLVMDTPLWMSITLAMLLIAVLLWSYLQQYRTVVFGIMFYICTIVLVLQFIPVGSAIVAERYSYIPYVGITFIVGLLCQSLYDRGYTSLVFGALVLLSFLLTNQTRKQCDVWQNHVSLFKQAVNVYPHDPFSRHTLAHGLWDAGEVDEAIYHTEYAINELGMVTSSAFELLANCYSDKTMTQEAIAFYNEAVRLDSSNVIARYHRGLLLTELDPIKAIVDFNFCERSKNDYVLPLLYSPRGRSYGLLGQYERALADFNKAIAYFPDDVNTYLDKAITLEKLNQFEEAIDIYHKVLDLDQNESLALERLNILNSLDI